MSRVEEFLAFCKAEDLLNIRIFLEEHRHDISVDAGLLIVAKTNHIHLASYLIDQGAIDLSSAFREACLHDSTDDMITFLLHQGANVHDNKCMNRAIFSDEINVIHKLVEAGYNDWLHALNSSIHHENAALFMFFLSKYHPTPDEVQEMGKMLQEHPNPDIVHVLTDTYNLIQDP